MRTIHAAAAAIRKKELTPVDLVEECLANIDRYEAKVRAWVFVDRDGARAEAKRLTEELERGQDRGPLHGIPIGVKDIFDVFDWPTAAGSKLWANAIARKDADVVARLRQAGAIFLGKTVTTAFASFDPPVTRNPWDLSKTPGGSSSGSAAALACGMCLGALGSQTGGSITRPASFCGVCGLKPSYGWLSCSGVVPLARSLDHPGPLARCVTDLSLLLNAMMSGVVPFQPPTWEAGELPFRFGRLRGLFEDLAEPATLQMMKETTEKLRKAGAEVIEMRLPSEFAEVLPRHRTVMAVEGAAFHEKRWRQHPEDYPLKITSLLQEGFHCPAPEYARCLEHQRALRRELDFWAPEVDALLTPATRGPAPEASTTGDPAFNSPWSYTGHPTVSLPGSWTEQGLPLAIQLVGRMVDGDKELLPVAAWCEKVLDFPERIPPL